MSTSLGVLLRDARGRAAAKRAVKGKAQKDAAENHASYAALDGALRLPN